MFFHFFVFSSISFMTTLSFSENRFFAFLVRFIPRYLVVLGAIVNGIDSLISLSSVLLLVSKMQMLV